MGQDFWEKVMMNSVLSLYFWNPVEWQIDRLAAQMNSQAYQNLSLISPSLRIEIPAQKEAVGQS